MSGQRIRLRVLVVVHDRRGRRRVDCRVRGRLTDVKGLVVWPIVMSSRLGLILLSAKHIVSSIKAFKMLYLLLIISAQVIIFMQIVLVLWFPLKYHIIFQIFDLPIHFILQKFLCLIAVLFLQGFYLLFLGH